MLLVLDNNMWAMWKGTTPYTKFHVWSVFINSIQNFMTRAVSSDDTENWVDGWWLIVSLGSGCDPARRLSMAGPGGNVWHLEHPVDKENVWCIYGIQISPDMFSMFHHVSIFFSTMCLVRISFLNDGFIVSLFEHIQHLCPGTRHVSAGAQLQLMQSVGAALLCKPWFVGKPLLGFCVQFSGSQRWSWIDNHKKQQDENREELEQWSILCQYR